MTDITEEQRANLTKLAAYLRTLPVDYPDFAMEDYVRGGYSSGPAHVPECGTAACAAGHGPSAGIAPFKGENWADYSSRAFAGPIEAWSWCFDSAWARVDNTAHGAAARIEWMLEHGVPENAEEQCYGKAPLCYLPSDALLAARVKP
jgi:hypothetical protein